MKAEDMAAWDWRDLEAVKRLKYRYMRCLDQKDWEGLRSCFTEDAQARYSAGAYAADGRDAIIEFLVRAMDRRSFLTSHRVTQPEIEFQSADRATGVWALDDVVVDLDAGVTIRGAAFYEDAYRRGEDGVWRICRTGYSRIYEERFPRASLPGLELTASYWETGGRSRIEV